MSIREVDLSGVEKALEDGYKLISGIVYEDGFDPEKGMISNRNIYAAVIEETDEGRNDIADSNPLTRIPNIPVSMSRAGFNYQNRETPEYDIEGPDAVTELTIDYGTWIEGEFQEGKFVLKGAGGDVEGRGDSLEEAYESYQADLLEKLDEKGELD